MGFFRQLFSSSGPGDGGALYDHVSGGGPIVLDAEEQSFIEEKLEEHKQRTDAILDNMAKSNRYLPENVVKQMYEQPILGEIAGALKELAYQRYMKLLFVEAANSCSRALGYAGQDHQGIGREMEPEIWHLLARIHATAGRFETASKMLDSAERKMNQVGRFASLPDALRLGWYEGVNSLRRDIAERLPPTPQRTVFHATLKRL